MFCGLKDLFSFWQGFNLKKKVSFSYAGHVLRKHSIPSLERTYSVKCYFPVVRIAVTPLHLACANGHVDVVTYLVENKCKLNLFDNDNRSPLMKAVQCQQEKCVAVLLQHGADPNLADADGNTALHLAVISPNISVAGLLLDHNANIDAQNKGCTPLILAVSEHHEEVVEFLLKKGADVHARDQCERTPLMTAASGGELNLIKVLLQYGADVSHKDTNGWTAEDYAVIHGYSR
uniref:Ankyrin repeat domain-containing protein 7 n=1 Tax=Buteo japonicus TaxID=224669 RepID=A0A8C0HH17_9AVES